MREEEKIRKEKMKRKGMEQTSKELGGEGKEKRKQEKKGKEETGEGGEHEKKRE